eukprot:c48672_g1_i1 orf=110-331(+)
MFPKMAHGIAFSRNISYKFRNIVKLLYTFLLPFPKALLPIVVNICMRCLLTIQCADKHYRIESALQHQHRIIQ